MTDELPDTCLRGLRKKDWKKDGGVISLEAFLPFESTAADRQRHDRLPAGSETSVNWEDDSEALEVTRADSTNAAHGVARVHWKIAFDAMAKIDNRADVFCERAALPNNKYHGNLVFRAGLEKYELKAIATWIAAQARPA